MYNLEGLYTSISILLGLVIMLDEDDTHFSQVFIKYAFCTILGV